jgi:hypothetical protein
MRRTIAQLSILLAVLVAISGFGPVAAQTEPDQPSFRLVNSAQVANCVIQPGTVVNLAGTPHLWIADEQRVLHWAGDTRALAGRLVNWANQCSLDEIALRQLIRGDPWLSAGLIKVGDPIYLVKWEDTEPAPRLLQIQSIADVELFGINEQNYGALVFERAAWETRYGANVDNLARGQLSPAVAPAGPASSAPPPSIPPVVAPPAPPPAAADPSPPPPAAVNPTPSTGGGCCRICTTGKPCGNTCIARSSTCRTSGGCACRLIQPLGEELPPLTVTPPVSESYRWESIIEPVSFVTVLDTFGDLGGIPCSGADQQASTDPLFQIAQRLHRGAFDFGLLASIVLSS